MSVQAFHQQAMEFADLAFAAKRNGELEEAGRLFRQAFERERSAAMLVAGNEQAEPTRSTLLRSAASLAMDCGEPQEAKRLVDIALAGRPPAEIADELRDVLKQVSLRQYDDSNRLGLERLLTIRFFRWAGTVAGVIYVAVFLSEPVWAFSGKQPSTLNIVWTVPQSPQLVIASCLLFSALALWTFRGLAKTVVSILFSMAIMFEFFLWARSTSQIKANTGLKIIPGANWIGNYFIGGGVIDLAVFVATALFLFISLWSLWANRRTILYRIRGLPLAPA
jgi:hypothetical protein